MKKNSPSFTCPRCQIEQHDLAIEETYLLSDPNDRTTICRCNSCGEILVDTEARTAANQTIVDLLVREESATWFEIIDSAIIWIIIILLIRCWLS